MSFTFSGIFAIPDFVYSVQINPKYEKFFTAEDMAQRLVIPVVPADLALNNEEDTLSLDELMGPVSMNWINWWRQWILIWIKIMLFHLFYQKFNVVLRSIDRLISISFKLSMNHSLRTCMWLSFSFTILWYALGSFMASSRSFSSSYLDFSTRWTIFLTISSLVVLVTPHCFS